jgi:hypothetical protein
MRLKPVILWAAAGFAFSVLACTSADTGGSAGYQGPVNTCEDDGDCPEGSICDDELSICASTGAAQSRKYFVKVVPRIETDLPEQVFEITVGPDSQPPQKLRAYALTPEFKLKIDALDREEKKTSLEVQAIITDDGMRIPGDSQSMTVVQVAVPAVAIGRSPWMQLLPGENHNYRIKVIPTGAKADRFPVHYFENITISETGGLYDSEGNKNPIFMIYEALTTLTGTIRRGGQPADGLSVEALDPDTGHVVSTRGVTGCQEESVGGDLCGDFEIRLARDVTRFSLRIWRANEPWYPEVVVPGFVVQQELRRSERDGETRADLVPLETPVKYRAFVRKPVLLPDGKTEYDGVNNSLVIFSSDDVAGGRVGRTVFTNEAGALEDENGNLGIDLFPGAYKITVIPPDQFVGADFDYCPLNWEMEQISGTSEIEGQVFPLEPRPLFKGSIRADGDKVLDGILRAEPHSSAPAFSRSSAVAVDSSGIFSIRVDKGRYRLTAEVAQESGYAWGAETREVSGDVDFDIELPIPFITRLDLVVGSDETTADVSGATVEWYEEIDDRAFLVGRSTSDAYSRVTALLRP